MLTILRTDWDADGIPRTGSRCCYSRVSCQTLLSNLWQPLLLTLTGFTASMGGERALRVEESSRKAMSAHAQKQSSRQAKHDIYPVKYKGVVELLRNSRDAARHIYVANFKRRCSELSPYLMMVRVFQKDMRRKSLKSNFKAQSMHMDQGGIHGRGMALYSIKENCESAQWLWLLLQ